jgi:putative ABC transport system permease protein
MRSIALLTLFNDRGRLAAALAGVAFAAMLVVVQAGLYEGFLDASSNLIRHAGGDLWVMAKGTEVLDTGQPLAGATRTVVERHPCVNRVRAMIYGWTTAKKTGGSRESVQVTGLEQDDRGHFPWTYSRGLPLDLRKPESVAIDEFDSEKLRLPRRAVGAHLEVGGRDVTVAATTSGIRSFTLQPFVFARAEFARRLLSMEDDSATFWIVDLKSRTCAAAVMDALDHRFDLQVMTAEDFRARTEEYWVSGSGAGAALGFSAALGLIVGMAIVGQTLYTITKEHTRELGTLKAMGATSLELVSFVLWQAAILGLVGGLGGVASAYLIRQALKGLGLSLVLNLTVLTRAGGAVAIMCAAASVVSARALARLDAARIFQ